MNLIRAFCVSKMISRIVDDCGACVLREMFIFQGVFVALIEEVFCSVSPSSFFAAAGARKCSLHLAYLGLFVNF